MSLLSRLFGKTAPERTSFPEGPEGQNYGEQPPHNRGGAHKNADLPVVPIEVFSGC